ncbi:MAG: hypothetical protein J6A99_00400, partial [Clostridia bacterium]|nr:hypothetical protein [Clostridia bacterium]
IKKRNRMTKLVLFVILMVLTIVWLVYTVYSSMGEEKVGLPIFGDINELDTVEELTLTSQQSNFKEDDLEIVEKRTYDCYIDGKLIEVEAYIFTDVKSSQIKFYQCLKGEVVKIDTSPDPLEKWTMRTVLFRSKYVAYRDNYFLYAKTYRGDKTMEKLLKIFDEKLSDDFVKNKDSSD